VLRLGEKEFTDVLGPSLFLKKEHELKMLHEAKSLPIERNKRSSAEIAAKWASIKTLRNIELDQVEAGVDTKVAMKEDWMIAALLALSS